MWPLADKSYQQQPNTHGQKREEHVVEIPGPPRQPDHPKQGDRQWGKTGNAS